MPYHVDVPSFGDWGFLLAATGERPAAGPVAGGAAAAFPRRRHAGPGGDLPADRARVEVAASTLMSPKVLEYAREEWRGY